MEKYNCAHCDTQKCPEGFTGPSSCSKCIHSQLSAEITKEDPDIQMLLDHAKDLYSSLLRGKTKLADDTLCDFYQT
ncbi:hypothetical protein DPMN_156957 [Dreissena polymorpha]|uniref:Uncharacterized protein n=1 Tax=Dreissena polymorpha TaxID=45954 RepID=A0A9D4J986_DREPO|nr:hypothetical protein DPMN_156957 [Dreissena polymorpha]